MNLCDATITKVLSEPYQQYNKWFKDVEIDCYGRISITTVMQDTKEELDKLTINSTILV